MPIYSLNGRRPTLPPDGFFWIAPNASVIGDVVVGLDVGIWFGAVVRGDNEPINIGARTNIQESCTLHTDMGSPLAIEIDVEDRHLQRVARRLGVVGGDDAEKLGPIVEFDRIRFLEPPGDRQFVVLEQTAKIILQHGTANRHFHRECERAVAILVVDRDRSELAFAERHIRRFA